MLACELKKQPKISTKKETYIQLIVLKKPWKAFFFDYRRQDNIGPVECTGKANLFKSE